MSDNVKRKIWALAGGVAFVLLLALAGTVSRAPAPLTAIEKRLVGDWSQIGLPGGEVLSDITFGANRTFRGNDGQFVGKWWIDGGQLHVEYYGGDWLEHWLDPVGLWGALRRHAADMDIRFVGDRGRVELAEPGEQPSCALIQSP